MTGPRRSRRSSPRCRRVGCTRPKERGHAYCCHMCFLLNNELTQVEALCRNTDRTQLSAEVWAAAVTMSDAWTTYQHARDVLQHTV